ncbi:MAG: UvrD-helicase domain-containing protein [Gemmatimonadetes bacterium]|nr:UvrD-helicase domain-containing protein [Gemmatimonadota bacterium]
MIEDLNAPQRKAVEHSEGPLLVLAGAGSGKTRVLTTRVAHLIKHRGVPANRVMAVTFTNKAAAEMKARVEKLLGYEPSGLWIGTFHSLSARLLRREARLIGFTQQFTIYDEQDSLSLIKRLMVDAGHSVKATNPRAVQAEISRAKNRLISAATLAEEAEDELQRIAADVYERMTKALLRANAMDFDDLLMHPLTVFRQHPERLARYQDMFRAVLVDEFQDTNRAQYLLVSQIAAVGRDICVVGDDDQSIYGWRGADVRNMLDFQDDFPDAQVVRLEENYRSTSIILDAANGVIEQNANRLGKTLFTTRSGGERVTVTATADEKDEAEWVLRTITEQSAQKYYVSSDFAVLYRTNAQSRPIEDVFRRSRTPYRVVGSISFYRRREIRNLIAYLRLIVNVSDDEAFLRAVQVPKRGIGKTSLDVLRQAAVKWGRSLFWTASVAERIREIAPRARSALTEFVELIEFARAMSKETSAAQLLELIIERTDYDEYLAEDSIGGFERIENVKALVDGAAEWSEEVAEDEIGTPLERYLASAALTTSADEVEGDPDGVTLMTVHSCKGLEWPVVFMTGMEDGLLPLSRSLETPEGCEEERRLAYVGITRAKDVLLMSWSRTRRRGGQLMPGRPSRFLKSLPPGLVVEHRTSSVFGPRSSYRPPVAGEWLEPSQIDYENESQDSPRYVKGERVRHRKFGSGRIIDVTGKSRDLKVVVDFNEEEVGPRTLLVAYAGLERDCESV